MRAFKLARGTVAIFVSVAEIVLSLWTSLRYDLLRAAGTQEEFGRYSSKIGSKLSRNLQF
jgi:hypothetical protein